MKCISFVTRALTHARVHARTRIHTHEIRLHKSPICVCISAVLVIKNIYTYCNLTVKHNGYNGLCFISGRYKVFSTSW